MTAIFNDLNAEQANGLACIVDGIDFTTDGRPHVPVGFSGSTGSQVFACATPCAAAVGYRPPAGEQLPLDGDCAPGCISPSAGVHTSCPGPRTGATVAGVR